MKQVCQLSIYLSVYPSVCLSRCLSVFLTVYLSVCLSLCISVCLSVGLSVRLLSVCCLSVCLSLYMHLSVYLSVRLCLSVRLYVYMCPSVSLSCLSVYLSRLSIRLSIKSMETLQNPPHSPSAVCDGVPLHFLSLQEDHFRDCVFLRSVCERRRLGAGHLAGGPGTDPWESGLWVHRGPHRPAHRAPVEHHKVGMKCYIMQCEVSQSHSAQGTSLPLTSWRPHTVYNRDVQLKWGVAEGSLGVQHQAHLKCALSSWDQPDISVSLATAGKKWISKYRSGFVSFKKR